MSEAEFLWKALAVIGVLSGAISGWFALTGRSQSRKIDQPLAISQADTYITERAHREACGHMERRVSALELRADRIERKMEEDKDEIIRAGEDRASSIHRRIDELKSEVANAPARTVALLKDTKGLL